MIATDVRRAVRGQEWLAGVAVGCLAVTTALSSVLYAGVASLSAALRAELHTTRGELLVVQPRVAQRPCALDDRHCDPVTNTGARAMAALWRAVRPAAGGADVTPVFNAPIVLHTARGTRRSTLIGTDVTLFSAQPLTVRAGRTWTASEERSARAVAVVGRALFDSLRRTGQLTVGATDAAVHGRLRAGRVTLEVIGVVESGTVSAVQVDHAVVVPRAVFTRARASRAPPAMLLSYAASLAETLHRLERQQRPFNGQLAVTTAADQLGDVVQLEQALTRGATGLSVVLTLSSLVAVTAMMATIARAHRRSVGIARAIGATRTAIAMQGALIGVVLGGVGVGCGSALAVAVIAALPTLLDVPPLYATTVAVTLLRGAAPAVLVSVLAGTGMFVRLSRARVGALLG